MLKLLNSLTQTTKLKRSKIPDTSLYIEQRNSGYSILLKFKSPTTFKQQYIKLNRFTYKQVVTTADKNETNLCEDCVQRFFNVSFKEQKKILQDNSTTRKQKIRLNKVLEQNSIREQVNELKQAYHGANWLYYVLTSFCDTYPMELLTALKELATNKEHNTALFERIENECDQSQRDEIEKLQGLNIFVLDIREELIIKILKPLIALEKLTVETDENPSLTRYCKWADGLDEQFTLIEELIEEGQLFFAPFNLERLKSIPLSKSNARLVQSLNWNINKAAKNN